MKMSEERKLEIKKLRAMLKKGTTIYCILRHVSKSGMSRRIDFCVSKSKHIMRITHSMARIIDSRTHRDGGMIVDGCGMDLGFHCVYQLSQIMWPNGSGYELRHEWL